jgi:hypothetical protein
VSVTAVTIKGDGYTVTIEQKDAAGVPWPDLLQTAITAVKGHYDYLNMADIVEHINDEWGYLIEQEEGEKDGYTFVTDGQGYVGKAEFIAHDKHSPSYSMWNCVGKEETESDTNTSPTVCGTAD